MYQLIHMCTYWPPLCIVLVRTCNSKSFPWGARTCEQCLRIKMASLSLKADRKCFMTKVSMPAFCTVSGKGCMTSPTTSSTRSLASSMPLAPNMPGRSTLWWNNKDMSTSTSAICFYFHQDIEMHYCLLNVAVCTLWRSTVQEACTCVCIKYRCSKVEHRQVVADC